MMSLEDDAIKTLGAVPLDEEQKGSLSESGRQPTTRLDNNRVTTRTYDDRGYPLINSKSNIIEFARFTAVKTGKYLELKFFEYDR